MYDILTLRHLIMGQRNLTIPDFAVREDVDVNQEELSRRVRYMNTL